MRIVIQRVKQASVTIDGEVTAAIGHGMLVLLGITHDDNISDIEYLAAKTAALRIFDDDEGVMNRSVVEADGDVLVVSQFTLHALTRKGNRPSYIHAAGRDIAIPLYEQFCQRLSELLPRPVERGVFGADMKVALINDGPVTIIIDSKAR